MRAAPFDGTRRGNGHKFQVGDPTFVVEHDHNDQLRVYQRIVKRVTPKQVHVEGAPGGRVIHHLSHDGNVWVPHVFPTMEAALERYIEQCNAEHGRAQRRLERSARLASEACLLLAKERERTGVGGPV